MKGVRSHTVQTISEGFKWIRSRLLSARYTHTSYAATGKHRTTKSALPVIFYELGLLCLQCLSTTRNFV